MRTQILLVIAVAVAASVARAQEAAPAGGCASIQSDSERLACYDRSARGTPAPPPSAPPAAPAPSAGPAAAAGAAGAAGTVGSAPASAAPASAAAATAAAPAPINTQPSPSTLSTAPSTSPRNARAPAPQPAPAVEPAAAAPLGVAPIVVLGTRALPGRGVEFTTDRGEVWVQADTQPLQLPPTPFNAEIKPGALGSVFLVPENRLGIRVRHHD